MERSMELQNLDGRCQTGYTTWGCIWPRGECGGKTAYRVYSEDGSETPVQTRVTAYWPDGSVKWTAHTADAARLTRRIRVTAENRQEKEASAAVPDSGRRQVCGSVTVLEAGALRLEYEASGSCLFRALYVNGRLALKNAAPVLILEEPAEIGGCPAKLQRAYEARIERVEEEVSGPLYTVLCFHGTHEAAAAGGGVQTRIPFAIRMKVGLDSRQIEFVHTFFYDGDEDRDFLKGIGVAFELPMKGELYNRHIKLETDHGVFHESCAQMLGWRSRLPEGTYERQMSGERLVLQGAEREAAAEMLSEMPHWDCYDFFQDSVSHFRIRKKLRDENCCYLECLDGCRTGGGAFVGSEAGSVGFAIRDFRQKYPSGYTFSGLTRDTARATVWLWPPQAEAMDFRHYANRGYNKVCYEGFDFKGADPDGIACTSEFALCLREEMIPEDGELAVWSSSVGRPAQYVGKPEYYHALHAFGRWSLPEYDTELKRWLEDQLAEAAAFYEREIEQRGWYGMFDYGDFMHSYDRTRHVWKYDMGGYAWDNTELVPTLWLWYYFLRTGREDIFTLAEKLSRHTSEVDVYHFGKYQGLGSRHNVRHWGCPCKEARIAMAGHHRVYYYLTGDCRMGEIFEEMKDSELAFLEKDPLETFYDPAEMTYPSHARSGPDWSSLCSDWMTRWERFHDEAYKQKILTGLEDIKKAPLKLISGPDFEFDPVTLHLRYIGEQAAGGTHLQICMGAAEIWLELAEWLDDKEFAEMLAEYGRFYFLPREKQLEESGGVIGDRRFTFPFMAAAVGAYSAWYRQDRQLAAAVWSVLLGALLTEQSREGFAAAEVENAGNRAKLSEIPWISTNFAAQWCLNTIVALEWIGRQLPETIEEGAELAGGNGESGFRQA